MSNIKPHIRISATAVSSTFVDDIRAIIEQGKQQAYVSVNASMIETYWHIGERIINIWKSRFPNLTWTHIYRTLRVGDDTAIRWYLGEASAQMWSVRTLDRNINTQYFERQRTALCDKIQIVLANPRGITS